MPRPRRVAGCDRGCDRIDFHDDGVAVDGCFGRHELAILAGDFEILQRCAIRGHQAATNLADDVADDGVAVIGRKLDYLFGRASGNAHNIERSTSMLRQMERIGLQDTPAARQFMNGYFQQVFRNTANVAAVTLIINQTAGITLYNPLAGIGATIETFNCLNLDIDTSTMNNSDTMIILSTMPNSDMTNILLNQILEQLIIQNNFLAVIVE